MDEEEVGREEGSADDREVDEQLGEAARMDDDERHPSVRRVLEVGEKGRELDEEREGEEDADERDRAAPDVGVREARPPERGRDEPEQEHGALLGEPAVDEPVRRVVAPTLVDRPPFEDADDRDQGRVQDRHGQDEDGQEERRHRGSRRLPARREPERREREAEELASRVAHEDRGGLAGPEVEGQEAGAGQADRERDDEHEPVRVRGRRVDGEVGARDRGHRRREPVHVVEEVERVRHPDEPEDGDRGGEDVAGDDLHLESRCDDERRRPDLARELGDRWQCAEVVGEAGGEDDRAAAQDAEELLARLERVRRERGADPGQEAGEEPDPAEERRLPLVPAVAARLGDDAAAERGADQRPRGEGGGRQREDGERGGHTSFEG